MRRGLIILLIAAFFVTACQQGMNEEVISKKKPKSPHILDEKTKIKNTVILYNSMLAQGYRKQNMTSLAEVATEKRISKAFYHMAALGEGWVRMDMNLKQISFSEIQILSSDKAEAATEEKWDYKYINFKTEEQVYDNSVDYVNRYKLSKISDKWFVDDINVISSKEKKSERYEPIAGHSKTGKRPEKPEMK